MKVISSFAWNSAKYFRRSVYLNLNKSIKYFSTDINMEKAIRGEQNSGIPLSSVLSELNNFADLSLAASWDNAGLLIQPYTATNIQNILLTNDLTEAVLDEAIEKQINLIISYHPPIFAALKRITGATWKERLVSGCLENRIAVFSPHTSWDAVVGGVNDWLADAFASHIKPDGRTPIEPSTLSNPPLLATIAGEPSTIQAALRNLKSHQILNRDEACSGDSTCLIACNAEDLNALKKTDLRVGSLRCESNEKTLTGMGRILQVQNLSIKKCVELVKAHTGLPFVRLALAKDKTEESEVRRIGVCAGSGASLLKGLAAELYLTGEMQHHDLLEANQSGTTVILTNHSDSERGFLKRIKLRLQDTFKDSVTVEVSSVDSDPLKTV